MRSLFGNLHSPSSFSPLAGAHPGRPARGSGLFWFVLCLIAGGLQATSLAWPFDDLPMPWALISGHPSGGLQIVTLALLCVALRGARRVGQATWRAWVFSAAWLGGTFWWLFVSMHTYGGLPSLLAVLAVFALAAVLALFYALAAGLLVLWAPRSPTLQALLFAALWTLAELMRGQWMTGFPWGAGGYAQVDLLGAWAPWVGVYGMGAVSALVAYALSILVPAFVRWVFHSEPATLVRPGDLAGAIRYAFSLSWIRGGLLIPGLLLPVLLLVVVDDRLQRVNHQHTVAAGDLLVWLLQGNVPQDEKFESGTGVADALAWYPAQLAEALARAQRGEPAPQLVVAPETALPLLPQQLGERFWGPLLAAVAQQPGEDPAVGILIGLPLGSFERGYTNSAWGIDRPAATRALAEAGDLGAAPFYRYDKHHLVPFGEFIPPLFRWFTDMMNIPLGDFDRGPLVQAPWSFGGQRIAPNICYEDLFGEELAAGFLDAAQAPTVLVNLSNIGWFGDTVAIDQHLQISRLRALELGRPMLRATNTGATAVIDHQGQVTHLLPRLTRDRLEAQVQGREGLTPYARWASRWGLWPLWLVCLGIVVAVVVAGRLRPPRRSS